LLLYTVLRRRLHPAHLPTETGTLVLDAAAAVAVGRFVQSHEAMLTVPLVVYEPAGREIHYLGAPVGTTVGDLLAHLRMPEGPLTIYGGPPPRDVRVKRDAVVSGAELTLYAVPPQADVVPDPCIRCGWCVEAC